MNKLILVVISFALSGCVPALAAVPIRWTVDTSRAQPAQFDAYRGETLALEATMQSYGSPLATPEAKPSLYWQTNGMGSAWWTAPATASGNVLRATWSHTNDCGGTVYNCFIGGPDATYRAAFRLRMLPSPGYTPNHLPLPTVKAESDPVFSAWLATNEFSSAGVVDTNAVLGLIAAATNAITHGGPYLTTEASGGRRIEWTDNRDGFVPDIPVLDVVGFVDIHKGIFLDGGADSLLNSQGDPIAYELTNAVCERVQSVENTVNAWQTYWDGDDVRVTVTNYYGQTGTPHLCLEEKMAADDTHDSTWFKIVWDELTRWNLFMPSFNSISNRVENDLADRAWGVYDSSTGSYSPDNVLQISQGTIYLANGMSYQKVVDVSGVWVLTANDYTMAGNHTNGFFKITDGDGNALFEIVKGDKGFVGASAATFTMASDEITIYYPVNAESHPILSAKTDLLNQSISEDSGTIQVDSTHTASVSWTGSTGAYYAHVTFNGPRPPTCFFNATYERGGDTYIKNSVPVGFDRVYINGHSYTVHVENINGKNLMVLE